MLKHVGGLALGVPFVTDIFGSISFFNRVKATEDPGLFPFQLSHDAPDNITNFEHLLDAPAGKYGFVRVKDGRFVTGKGPVKFSGTNLTGAANFPSRADADKLAKRLAGLGMNCVRLHYMDTDYSNFLHQSEQGIIAPDATTQRNLDAQQLDRLDYLIAAFKKRGIYVNINLHVARWWDDRDGFPHKNKRPKFDKGLDNFEPRMIELQKEYARKLLTHVNPYTKLSYANEPAVAMLEINNENSLFNQYFRGTIDKLPDPYAAEFRKQWNTWLIKKYKTTEALKKAWESSFAGNGTVQNLLDHKVRIENCSVPTLKVKQEVHPYVRKDFYQFITDTEYSYWTGMYKFLKEELKVKSPVSGTQIDNFSNPFVQAELDYIDTHGYWCHPGPVDSNWRIRNEALVNSMGTVQSLASQRVFGKPYTVSEYNNPFPNQYGAEGLPLLMSYGSLNGWDGFFEYSFHHRKSFTPSYNTYFFSIMDRAEVLAHFRACSAIFLRGDVAESKTGAVGAVHYDKYLDYVVKANRLKVGIDFCGIDRKNCLVRKSSVHLSGTESVQPASDSDISEQKVLVSDTGELIWNIEDADAGYFVANTANTKLFTGFPKGRKISLGNIDVSIGESRLGWATISLISKNGNGFGEEGKPSSILLVATGLTENKGMTIVKYPGNKIALSNWGSAPVYVEGISATLTFPIKQDRIKCYALDTAGNRMTAMATEEKNNNVNLHIGPEYKTIWYEIEIG